MTQLVEGSVINRRSLFYQAVSGASAVLAATEVGCSRPATQTTSVNGLSKVDPLATPIKPIEDRLEGEVLVREWQWLYSFLNGDLRLGSADLAPMFDQLADFAKLPQLLEIRSNRSFHLRLYPSNPVGHQEYLTTITSLLPRDTLLRRVPLAAKIGRRIQDGRITATDVNLDLLLPPSLKQLLQTRREGNPGKLDTDGAMELSEWDILTPKIDSSQVRVFADEQPENGRFAGLTLSYSWAAGGFQKTADFKLNPILGTRGGSLTLTTKSVQPTTRP